MWKRGDRISIIPERNFKLSNKFYEDYSGSWNAGSKEYAVLVAKFDGAPVAMFIRKYVVREYNGHIYCVPKIYTSRKLEDRGRPQNIKGREISFRVRQQIQTEPIPGYEIDELIIK